MGPHQATGEPASLDDYRWLVSDEARPWLDRAANSDATPLRLATELRHHLPPARVHLVLQQAELRQRALKKGRFPNAHRMLFTPQLLEQATSAAVAAYKAQRYSLNGHVADLCCGIGGDLLAMAERCHAVGVDRNCVAALLADANCRALELTGTDVKTADATRFPVQEFSAWHIDPDRRPTGRRTTRPEFYDPNLDCIQRLLSQASTAAIKLAPAAEAPPEWSEEAELEWIGEDRECKQQVAWFGELAQHPGRRAATVLHGLGTPPTTIVGQSNVDAVHRAAAVGEHVYEPHATVLAAGLVNVLADRHALEAISPDFGYLTSDTCISEPVVAGFQVDEVLPLDIKRVKAALRRLKVGELEIKKRGIDVEPRQLRRQLRVPGDQKRTLLLTRFHGKSIAILATKTERLRTDNP